MAHRKLGRFALSALDRLTEAFPRFAPQACQQLLLTILGNRPFYAAYQAGHAGLLNRVRTWDRILVVADVNIGDAVTLQQSVVVLKHRFPNARIDYLCNRYGGRLVFALPQADHVFAVVGGRGIPSQYDLTLVRDIVKRGQYDVILNLCPFIERKDFQSDAHVIQLYLPLASYIIRSWKRRAGPGHVSFAVHTFLQGFLDSRLRANDLCGAATERGRASIPYRGNSIYLTHEAISLANEFMAGHNLRPGERLLLYNPHASSQYTQMPVELQIRIVSQLLASEDIEAVLLSSGHRRPGIERLILAGLPTPERKRVMVIPFVPLGVYAALIDACDMFISGDTGPVHLAASWKVALAAGDSLRNRTSIVTIFGGTDSALYGYDSTRPQHLSANQQAPSRVFVAPTPCRNITCINKQAKSCRTVRCFQGLKAEDVASYALSYFRELRQRACAVGKTAAEVGVH